MGRTKLDNLLSRCNSLTSDGLSFQVLPIVESIYADETVSVASYSVTVFNGHDTSEIGDYATLEEANEIIHALSEKIVFLPENRLSNEQCAWQGRCFPKNR